MYVPGLLLPFICHTWTETKQFWLCKWSSVNSCLLVSTLQEFGFLPSFFGMVFLLGILMLNSKLFCLCTFLPITHSFHSLNNFGDKTFAIACDYFLMSNIFSWRPSFYIQKSFWKGFKEFNWHRTDKQIMQLKHTTIIWSLGNVQGICASTRVIIFLIGQSWKKKGIGLDKSVRNL